MTDSNEFRSQPKPGDWAIPSGIEEMLGRGDGIDPVTLSIIKEHDYKGVPIPFSLQAAEEMVRQLDRLDAGEDPGEIVAEMIADFAEKEERYPDTDIWDNGRDGAVRAFVEHGHLDEASQLLDTFTDPHRAAKTVLQLGQEGAVSEEDTVGLLGKMIHGGDRERSAAVARTARDDIIANDPSSELVETYNDILARLLKETDFDWVQDWVESQREADPRIDWGGAESWLKDDEAYAGMPMPERMYRYLRLMETMKLIEDGGMDEDLTAAIAENFDEAREEEYGEAKIFDRELASLAKALVQKGETGLAAVLAGAVQDPDILGMTISGLANSGHEQEAIELAASNPDPKMAAILLLDVGYPDSEAGLQKLAEIIRSDEYPAEKRIGCLEVIRDRMLTMGHHEAAEKYQQMLDELREEQ